ncbi:hypothetical protein I204_02669 [Kwoniella mangroviensis CBS 8886]|uniref:hypothetical protein n=1 Tax=Kwoniella mangroviensis CBS 8507 TaxID=1296122 RepID=UPI00080D2D67|nr:uncharacterized protein I203_01963 [Kwoniella mangroviensis CBS 8507]OCF68580.1 hypothetical protein I203_01963 [Kwoniella mangroviensis CBS 8507]OCF76960.1 hypothetical protein I204_02669 [Kwoniella mangroviensis CBS 8886]
MSPNPPSFLLPYLEKYPIQAGALLTTIYDLTLSVGWIDTRLTDLGGWVALIGHKTKSDPLRAVIPLPIHTTSLKPSSLKSIFNALSSLSLENLPQPSEKLAPTMDDLKLTIQEQSGTNHNVNDQTIQAEEGSILDQETIYTSIVTPDSTVVYYKISRGIKKPNDIPDE